MWAERKVGMMKPLNGCLRIQAQNKPIANLLTAIGNGLMYVAKYVISF